MSLSSFSRMSFLNNFSMTPVSAGSNETQPSVIKPCLRLNFRGIEPTRFQLHRLLFPLIRIIPNGFDSAPHVWLRCPSLGEGGGSFSSCYHKATSVPL